MTIVYMIQYIKIERNMEMFKRRNSQGEEEGTFYVLHIIPLFFSLPSYFYCP